MAPALLQRSVLGEDRRSRLPTDNRLPDDLGSTVQQDPLRRRKSAIRNTLLRARLTQSISQCRGTGLNYAYKQETPAIFRGILKGSSMQIGVNTNNSIDGIEPDGRFAQLSVNIHCSLCYCQPTRDNILSKDFASHGAVVCTAT